MSIQHLQWEVCHATTSSRAQSVLVGMIVVIVIMVMIVAMVAMAVIVRHTLTTQFCGLSFLLL
ncbi:MAG TPA: hypothetical protein PKH51_01580, partial [Candidatus Sumerlaeota bacterium]|nr:hypothetical protein [Candidatus Sumerlaeota bacterium]